MPTTVGGRTVVAVDGAAGVLAAALAAGSPQAAALQLRELGPGLEVHAAREATVAEGRAVVLATDASGAALALRWFPADAPTTIHEHRWWGAALVLEGRDRYERFEIRDGAATLDATLWLEVGDVVWWLEPPHDVHRQEGLDKGALELILVASPPSDYVRVFPTANALTAADPLAEAMLRAYQERRFAPLRDLYHDEVIADVCVPSWRFQLLDSEEFGLDDQRLQAFRTYPMIDGCVVEVAVRFRHEGKARMWRDVHILRSRDGKVSEHLAYCTGHLDAATIDRQQTQAPMIRS